ncbi:MAG: hypothetical protein Q9187_001740 [Circinaria calcarea]
MSWFWRGFQSAVFYYVSCAPCSKLNSRRKRRSESRRAKVKKAAGEEGLPELYRHPSPFSTNIYWREEMALGPGPPPRKGNRDSRNRAGSSRECNTGELGSSAGGSSADTTLAVDSIQGAEMEQDRISGEGWNRQRYQRADELLWGDDIEKSINQSGVSRSGTTGIASYHTARNPAVNDLHPPVVSTQPTHRSEIKWMLQPPPSAKVMEGKERANRSRSGSGGSHGSGKKGVDSTKLGRQIGERLVGGRSRRGARPPIEETLASQTREDGDFIYSTEPIEAPGQRHDRDTELSSELKWPENSAKRGPPPSFDVPDVSSRAPLCHKSDPPQRSPLSTIASSSNAVLTVRAKQIPSHRRLPNKLPRLHLPLDAGGSTSSLHVLQELVSSNSSLSMRAPSPSKEADIRLPSATENEEMELRLPEFETRFPGRDYRFPDSPEERGRDGELGDERGILSSWSMYV